MPCQVIRGRGVEAPAVARGWKMILGGGKGLPCSCQAPTATSQATAQL